MASRASARPIPLLEWEKARNWLAHPEVTKMSAKVPGLADLKKESELYTYLKDGTELCRMIGLVTKGQVLEGITYRTNNISTLEEKNISLFLDHVVSHVGLKRDKLFKNKEERVFRLFADFHLVLYGLSKISEKLTDKIGVPKFESKTRLTASDSDDEDNDNGIYDCGEEGGGNEVYDTIYSEQVMEGGAPTSLDMAVKEMVDFNNTYITRVLENIKNNFESKHTTHLLKREFFKIFEIDKLLGLHRELKCRLEWVQHNYVDIGKTFDDLKDDFLVYCEVTSKIKTATEFLADQMTENQETQDCIKQLQSDAIKARTDMSMPCEIKDLMQMIPQHVMRYHMVIESIEKQARKAKKTDVEREARRACKIMKNMTSHTDRVSKDYKYITAMEEFKGEIKNLPFDTLHRFGVLKRELNNVKMSTGNIEDQPFHLLIFNDYIVALENVTKEVLTKQLDFFGIPIRKKVIEKKYLKCFKIREFGWIRTKEVGRVTEVQANAVTEAKTDKEKSFTLKFDNADEANQLETEMKGYLEAAHAKIYYGSQHQGHSCEKFRANGHFEENISVRCGCCNELLQGLLYEAVKCMTCDKFYHCHCFSAEISNQEELYDDPIDFLIQKKEDLDIKDFDIGEAKRGTVVSKLRGKPHGTFLLRFKAETGNNMLAVKNSEEDKGRNITNLIIKELDIHDKQHFYIEKGTTAPTLLELVQKHRRSHQLFVPINTCTSEKMEDKEDEDDDDEEEEVDGGEIDEILAQAHNRYFYGDITSAEAGQELKGQEPGTYLVRQNDNTFKLSWLTFHSRLMHAVIKFEREKYFLITRKKFSTIEELMRYYTSLDRGDKMALGSPKVNHEMEAEMGRGKTDEEIEQDRIHYRKEEPFLLPCFKGTVNQQEAEEMMHRELDGSYILRVSDYDEMFISYKSKFRVWHISVTDNSSSYSVVLETQGVITETSIKNLLENMSDQGVFLSPLRSSRIPILASASEPTWVTKKRAPAPPVPVMSKPVPKQESEEDNEYEPTEPQPIDNLYEPTEPHPPPARQRTQINFSRKYPVVGRMDNKRTEGVLKDYSEGSWLLRLNNAGEERISVKKVDRVVHIKIYHFGGGATLRPNDNPVPLDDLIDRLIAQGTLGEQVEVYL